MNNYRTISAKPEYQLAKKIFSVDSTNVLAFPLNQIKRILNGSTVCKHKKEIFKAIKENTYIPDEEVDDAIGHGKNKKKTRKYTRVR